LVKSLLFQPTLQFLQTYVEDQNRSQQTKIKLKEQQVKLNAEESTELRDQVAQLQRALHEKTVEMDKMGVRKDQELESLKMV